MILSREEVYKLTGYRQPSKQIKTLREHGIRFIVGADGHPRVLKSHLDQPEPRRGAEPNYDALT